jgi:hypothetical protein
MVMDKKNWKDWTIYILGGMAVGLIGAGAVFLRIVGKLCNCF